MSKLTEISQLQSLRDVAIFLGCEPKNLAYSLYFDKNKYKSFEIHKKNGGVRIINAPNEKLKSLQKILACQLNECLEEIYRMHGGNKISHGFAKGKTIITNASKHRNKHLVFNIDLTDFFGTINFGRVRGFFIKNNHFNLNEKAATILAQIACHEGKLPQGSPCSPVISNLILNILDVRLAKLASTNSCTYTRYADDLTFSTNKTDFPSHIAMQSAENIWIPGSRVRKEIVRSGFSVNDKKTRLQYYDSRQDVTGLVVNKVVNVPSEYRRLVKSMVHQLFNTNEFYLKLSDGESLEGSQEQLGGMLNYIYSTRKTTIHHGKVKRDSKGNLLLDASDRMYSDFLYYKYFVANNKPIIICEGKTDVAYMKYAIKSRSNHFPSLVEETEGKKQLKIQILAASNTVNHLLDLLNGTSSIKKFIELYDSKLKKYKNPILKNPVIILTDNDSGSSNLIPTIRGKYKSSEEKDGFYFITKNLYLIKTPLINGNDSSKIEDFFSKELLSRKLDGKTFHPDNDTDNTMHYSKNVFVEKIIRKEYKSIDFSGFDSILNFITNIISMHK
ncbi:retron Ec67 family RNA-directed DNA polymerase/endonuclease [Klebsiella variicola subsp. variicola]|uniref:retron Ec67 family RNA-directed DNA polymerase/endonuclease n=1 Tax=Klebsiella variicola TaxID=244366 RepID=UPI000D74D81B|nr:retron Ec67 family RNA-directed DNA polymerase/endonuclease [Klebsiella variicola]MCI4400515.1 ribonuclease H [Klebsiella variicola]PXM35860.1 ribonuclease H [Klebsiella variicola]